MSNVYTMFRAIWARSGRRLYNQIKHHQPGYTTLKQTNQLPTQSLMFWMFEIGVTCCRIVKIN